ncbi:GAF domain-containing protein, partial [Sedimenticola sp.]|uniref:GAF domain-containing protein n=1 Tax=Sedimenticola sp. TaxID=1940285 RepID=UPI00258847C6
MSKLQNLNQDISASESALHPVLVTLLQISLSNRALRDCMQEALRIILTAPFSELLPSGAIFLASRETRELQLLVHENLAEPLHTLCARVPFGHCLCGRAAVERQIIHAACVDERHEILFDGIQPHGHYNVPILSGARVLGVMVLYLPHGHRR